MESGNNAAADVLYLAGPYSKGSPEVRLARFNALTHVAARFVEARRIVYSPITMTHPIDLVLAADGETLGSDFWVSFDEAFMKHCTSILVVTLPGWQHSSGVVREVQFFADRGISAQYVSPSDFGVSSDNPLFAAAFSVADSA